MHPNHIAPKGSQIRVHIACKWLVPMKELGKIHTKREAMNMLLLKSFIFSSLP